MAAAYAGQNTERLSAVATRIGAFEAFREWLGDAPRRTQSPRQKRPVLGFLFVAGDDVES